MRSKDLRTYFLSLLAIIILNLAGNQYFLRFDLTEDQRYSISPATKEILRNLDQEIFIKVYLEGDLPAGFKRLQTSIRETLDEFKIYAGNKLNYRFINPIGQGKNPKEQQAFYIDLAQRGVTPTNIFVNEGQDRVQKLIFPGALVTFYDKESGDSFETPALLFKIIDQKVQSALSPEQILNQSVENVEFNLISAIRKIGITKPKRVGFIVGHAELENIEMATAITRLQEFYEVVKIPLPLEKKIKEGVDAIIVAKPDSAFTDEDKYKIDQYIMRGGKALFFLDVVGLHMDSVIRDKGAFTFPVEHNLRDLFFKYGVRLNQDLIKDLNAGLIPIVVGNLAQGQANIQAIPWQYHPLLNTFGKHPIVKNMSPIQAKFVSSVDTIKTPGTYIKKTPLLYTSQYSIIKKRNPDFVSYDEERQRPDPQIYNEGPVPVAYLLEGSFNSAFKSMSFSKREGFKDKSPDTKILVCSDGDLIRNEVDSIKNEPLPLGFDRFRQTTFSNADFLMNAIDYMIDEQGVIQAKNKEISLRPLDKIKLKEQRRFWQILNLLFPVFLVLLFAFGNFLLRRQRYTRWLPQQD